MLLTTIALGILGLASPPQYSGFPGKPIHETLSHTNQWIARSLGQAFDSPLADDTDLDPGIKEVPEELNSFEFLRDFKMTRDARLHDPDIRRILDDDSWDQSEAEKLLAKCHWADDLLAKIKAKPNLAYPADHSIFSPGVNFSFASPLSRVLQLRYRSALSQGDFEKGRQTFHDLEFLANFYLDSNGSLIESLIGKAFVSRKLLELRKTIEFTKVPDTYLRDTCLAAHTSYNVRAAQIGETFRREYQHSSSTIDELASGAIPQTQPSISIADSPLSIIVKSPGVRSIFTFQTNRTKNIFADYFRSSIQQLAVLPKDRKPLPEIPFTHEEFVKESLTGNFDGARLVQLSIPAIQTIVKSIDLSQVDDDLTYILIALKLYEATHGTLPDQLAQLSPEIIPRLPLDHFSQEPYQYDREKRRIWSVGNDFANDGGLDKANTQRARRFKLLAHEPTLQIP